jgi:hypothetical protein
VISESQSEMVQLSEDELDEVVGAGCHHQGHHHRHRNRHRNRHLGHHHGIAQMLSHGGGHSAQSESHFHKHTLSITGQTITNADGSSVTSFSIHEEDIFSSSFQSLED